MSTELRDTSFDPWQELARHTASRDELKAHAGATACFVGTMRDFNDGDTVHGMTLEHYPGMTERYLASISEQARERWPIQDTLIIHRVGEVAPGDPIVLVATWSAHRGAAFDACRFMIEELKHRAAFWKKETLAHGSRWVATNTEG